jgi:orotate phosphoribosyltransferase
MSQWTAHHLGLPSVFSEHQDLPDRNSKEIRPPFTLKRGFDKLVAGKKVLIVDDVVNTGHSIRETANAVRACNGEVTAAAAYCTRGNTDAAGMGVPQFIYLVEFRIPFWSAESCMLCKSGVPINTEFAHGREFVERKS